ISLPKLPPVIIRLIPNNGNKTSTQILQIHEKVLEIVRQLLIYIVSVGSDGVISEFNAQNNKISDSYTIAMIANTVANFNTIDICNDDTENDLKDIYLELAFLLSDKNYLSDQNLETYEIFYTGVTEAGILDIFYLVNL
ncbi:23192_t:CDS:2, partial [Racocetra persica]